MLTPIALIRATVDGMMAPRLRPHREHHLGHREVADGQFRPLERRAGRAHGVHRRPRTPGHTRRDYHDLLPGFFRTDRVTNALVALAAARSTTPTRSWPSASVQSRPAVSASRRTGDLVRVPVQPACGLRHGAERAARRRRVYGHRLTPRGRPRMGNFRVSLPQPPSRPDAGRLAVVPGLLLGLVATLGVAADNPAAPSGAATVDGRTRNVVLFVADGLRPGSVNAHDAPTLAGLRDRGVWFANSHAIYPTVTTVNAAAIATGHLPVTRGISAMHCTSAIACSTAASSAARREAARPSSRTISSSAISTTTRTAIFSRQTSLLALAREHGYATASIGKIGPVGSRTSRSSRHPPVTS